MTLDRNTNRKKSIFEEFINQAWKSSVIIESRISQGPNSQETKTAAFTIILLKDQQSLSYSKIYGGSPFFIGE